MLKALFDTENFVNILNPVVPTEDGKSLAALHRAPLTVEGELNKLASNIASGRNIAGVHWRSDAHASLRIGQALAISLLHEQKASTTRSSPASPSRGFDGERIVVGATATSSTTSGNLRLPCRLPGPSGPRRAALPLYIPYI